LPSRQRCWCEGDDITIYAQAGNLSEGGLFLRTSAPLPPGARVRVRIGSGSDAAELAARVAWRRDPREEPPREGLGMGLRFETGDDGERAAVRSQLDLLRAGS
jgi:uncharacterized protein (TIGR02266 family)